MQKELVGSKQELDQKQTAIPDMAIVLVCWNNRELLDACLQSVYDGNLQSSFVITVTDNGSTDGSQAMLAEKYPDVILIENGHNVGLGKASNQGIDVTQSRYVLLLNNDTLVDGAALDQLVTYLDENPDVGAVGGRLLNPDGSFQAGYAPFSTLSEEFLIATHLGELLRPGYPSHGDTNEIEEVGWMSSACLLLRRAALDQVGLLDESYFIYGDEADLQYRLKVAGWNIRYLPQVNTIHFGGRSMNRWGRRKMVYRGKMLFYQKNYSSLQTAMLRLLFGGLSFLKLLSWAPVYLVPGQRERARKELRSNADVMQLCYDLK